MSVPSRCQISFPVALVLLGLGWVSCDQVRESRQELSQKIRQQAADKQDQLLPRFDARTPDTESNRRRFAEFLDMNPPAGVRRLYCYADELGADATYALAFESGPATTRAIIQRLGLQPDTTGLAFSGQLLVEQAWWDQVAIARAKPYSKREGRVSSYLWRDEKTARTYFLTFDQ
ncbi:hypothetical protein LJY25_14090 [Hymenobacter sp. BT175]|uniref:hypothetical protein n=1 Tax=Hymenobacter translucens TaxID=2886507 RepID=UPI001D0EEB6B|nr:hypothetical protein [Hymenobacter translucens]MCC2547583.1 hypothetical protein [Hymenobacter translucens]